MREERPVLSLFSGAGGLDLAVERADADPLDSSDPGQGLLSVAVATDYNEQALATLAKNFPRTPITLADIRDVSTAELLNQAGVRAGEPTLVVGGPPCTPFSKSGFWLEQKRTSSDPNASLLDEYVRVVREARPEAFVLENVQGLTYSTHRAQFERLLRGLGELGYNPQWKSFWRPTTEFRNSVAGCSLSGRRDGENSSFPSRRTRAGVSVTIRSISRSFHT